MMKIIIAHPCDPSSPSLGGDTRQTLNFLEYFTKRGIETTLLGVRIHGKAPLLRKFAFVPILNTDSVFGFRYALGLMLRIPFLRIPRSATILTYRLMYVLPFVLLCPNNPKVLRTGAMPLMWVRVNHPRLLRPFSVLYKNFESVLIRKLNLIIPVDEVVKQYYVKQHPELRDSVIAIPVGINLDQFKPLDKKGSRKKHGFCPEEKIILFVGRVERIKSLDFLVRSYKLVKERTQKAKLVIVGRGSDEPRLKRLAQELGIEDVIFMGFQKPDIIPEILNCADVVALCSLSERSPHIVREAIACGVPVVSTDVGDVRYIITNDSVGRVLERNEKRFADAIIEVLNLDTETVRSECRKISKGLGLNEINGKIMMLFQKLEATGQKTEA